MKQVELFAINDGKSRGKQRRGEEKITVAKQKLRFLLQKRKKEKRKLGESETQLCCEVFLPAQHQECTSVLLPTTTYFPPI